MPAPANRSRADRTARGGRSTLRGAAQLLASAGAEMVEHVTCLLAEPVGLRGCEHLPHALYADELEDPLMRLCALEHERDSQQIVVFETPQALAERLVIEVGDEAAHRHVLSTSRHRDG